MTRRPASGLPFGAVMATGAAAQLAPMVGFPALRLPFLVVTIAIAVAVTGAGIAGLPRWLTGRRSGPPRLGFGHFTVPVGLAVIALGLVAEAAPAPVVAIVMWLAWVTTAVLLVVVMGRVIVSWPGLRAVNGLWFIAPAALLADGAAAALLRTSSGPEAAGAAALDATARACVWAGTAGFGVLLVLAAVRVARHRLDQAPRVAWWIVVGCGGLAADALGRVAGGAPDTALAAASVACWVIATIALVPVTVGSVRFLAGVRSLRGRPAWPPAFSSGVYALGTAEVAALFPALPVGWLAVLVAAETLVVWVVTAAVRVAGTVQARQAAER